MALAVLMDQDSYGGQLESERTVGPVTEVREGGGDLQMAVERWLEKAGLLLATARPPLPCPFTEARCQSHMEANSAPGHTQGL